MKWYIEQGRKKGWVAGLTIAAFWAAIIYIRWFM
jgi:hypothetical protein